MESFSEEDRNSSFLSSFYLVIVWGPQADRLPDCQKVTENDQPNKMTAANGSVGAVETANSSGDIFSVLKKQ